MALELTQVATGAKECPCCGNKKIVTDAMDFFKAYGLKTLSIYCKKCDLALTIYKDDYHTAYVEALTRWNTRTAEKPTEEAKTGETEKEEPPLLAQ